MRLALVLTALLVSVEANRRSPSAPLKADIPRMWGYPYGWGISDEDEPEIKEDIEAMKPVKRGTFKARRPLSWRTQQQQPRQEKSTILTPCCSSSCHHHHQSPTATRRFHPDAPDGSTATTRRRTPTSMSRTSQISWNTALNSNRSSTSGGGGDNSVDDHHDWVFLYDPL